jgi:flagellar assembly protein FliH
MAAAQKFMFGRDFAEEPVKPGPRQAEPEPAPEPAPEPEPEPEPSFTAAELEAARAEGHAQGHAQGLAEGREAAAAAADQALTQATDALAGALERFAAADRQARERRDREALEVTVGLLRRLFPALARKHGHGEIEKVFQDALERLRDEPRVVVRCADRHLDPLRERVDGLAARLGYEGRVVLLADETMQPGDARVEWADGGVERDSARLWQDVERAVERALTPPAPEPQAHGAATETVAPAAEAGGAQQANTGAPGTGDAGAGETAPADTAAGPAAERASAPAATSAGGNHA